MLILRFDKTMGVLEISTTHTKWDNQCIGLLDVDLTPYNGYGIGMANLKTTAPLTQTS